MAAFHPYPIVSPDPAYRPPSQAVYYSAKSGRLSFLHIWPCTMLHSSPQLAHLPQIGLSAQDFRRQRGERAHGLGLVCILPKDDADARRIAAFSQISAGLL